MNISLSHQYFSAKKARGGVASGELDDLKNVSAHTPSRRPSDWRFL